MYKKG
ncbi:hypothetical protein SAMN05661044_02254 [Olivibacter domesticus]